ncbi:D-alanyl-D-alanine carboxypeptidase family protein [Streptomyces spectabilis]|uniref:D-alanyl-D-alanine carboxypeptidase (Penicillin-binding protein 5/6) n=1 Tax=Streptomyces spectabilis TaxID=68270 RepID=A0A7W8AT88_STRST|nr:D-alanyl-D-alanine carboxypeptidase [Streptomyces spectabilis]MBB5102922.1 D-alanyl-D-alanine carboxypeptidase (penicillin-binding protein 5/6) [Streptomyces spectabilis]MCI3902123.1 D-alanyl-D-alanine carboxypeptidase [Streptomyces spectabilis]
MRGRRVRGVGAVCGGTALLAVVGVGGWFGFARGEGGEAPRPGEAAAVAGRLDLPWPGEGQTSIAVEGLGSLGREGGRQPVPIASVAKVMTAYVILKEHPLAGGQQGPRIRVDAAAAEESHSLSESTAPLREGRRPTQRQLLELLLLPSGNNVARLLARWDAGSEKAFVVKMNRAAARLGMDRTTYTGASGFEASTRSTADDQLKLARQAMKEPVLRAVVALRSTTVPGVPGTVTNTNRLLDEPGVIGLKTGSSTPAGGNLMWAAEVTSGAKRHLVLGVVLGQRARTTPTEGLDAALEKSGALIEAVRTGLPAALRAGEPVRT